MNETVDLADREIFPLKFFRQIYEPSLPPHILWLKFEMLVMLLYNLDLPRLCSGTKIQLRFISQKVLEGVIMGEKYKGQKTFFLAFYYSLKTTMSDHRLYLHVANFQSGLLLL